MKGDSQAVLGASEVPSPNKKLTVLERAVLLGVGIASAAFAAYNYTHLSLASETHDQDQSICPQFPSWSPSANSLPTPPDAEELANLLSQAVQINTSVYDTYPLPISSSPGIWNETFHPFFQYLGEVAFPDVFNGKNRVKVEMINGHGMVLTWRGFSEEELKPVMFMAHQDVVPVDEDTLPQWTHHPFSGYIDWKNEVVWGRGSSDDKSSLITLLTSLRSLILDYKEKSKIPKRTIILAFGFDEEASGTQGAGQISNFLLKRYGKGGIEWILDEGEGVQSLTSLPNQQSQSLIVAGPSVAEKGYLDVELQIETRGGHSSRPPQHTTIGLLAKMITAIEDRPWMPEIVFQEDDKDNEDSPGLKTLLCLVDAPTIAGTKLGNALKRLINFRKNGAKSKRRLNGIRRRIEEALDEVWRGAFITTQAIDLVSGGVKINALPESASTMINHRIAVSQDTQTIRQSLYDLIQPISERYGLQIETNWTIRTQKSMLDASNPGGRVTLRDAFESALEPAPISATTKSTRSWQLLSGVIKSSYGDNVRVVPTVMEGNTDTKSYWQLSTNIYRFSPNSLQKSKIPGSGDENIHTVDEYTQIDGLVQAHDFYTRMMIAAQE